MVSTSYTKSISVDFPNGKINGSKFKDEISASSITIALDHIEIEGDDCVIWFKNGLSTDEQNTLNTLVSNHTGEIPVSAQLVKIQEESTDTGGNFGGMTVKVTANAGSSATYDTFFPYPVSALSISFFTGASHKGDKINLIVSPDTIIGGISADLSPANTWLTQNYVVGDKVKYTTTTYGERVYTCVVNTISNETPTNKTYWKVGYEIPASSTVIANTLPGYYITLDDGTNSEDVGRIVSKTSTKIYVENSPTNSYVAATPTYVKLNVKLLHNFEFGEPWSYVLGESKIGGSYVPADTLVRLEYINNGGSTNDIVGVLEYLY